MTDFLSFKGQVALVTGGCGGIGTAIANALAKHGAKVVVADLREPTTALASGMSFVELDVRDVTAVLHVMKSTSQRFGRIDVLINAAGVVTSGSAAAVTESQWDHVMSINLKGSFFCCQAVMPYMKAASYGRIVNIGSVLGKNGGNPRPWINNSEQAKAGNVAYGVTKAGVHAMTAYLAKELARFSITVNALAPGPVESSMTKSFPQVLKDLIPLGRMGRPEEISDAALFLASSRAGFITGEVLDINGGLWND
jgi:NAD(P)-dependent dehydrogenase (short-subunit alcohol dehydrogenase family)